MASRLRQCFSWVCLWFRSGGSTSRLYCWMGVFVLPNRRPSARCFRLVIMLAVVSGRSLWPPDFDSLAPGGDGRAGLGAVHKVLGVQWGGCLSNRCRSGGCSRPSPRCECLLSANSGRSAASPRYDACGCSSIHGRRTLTACLLDIPVCAAWGLTTWSARFKGVVFCQTDAGPAAVAAPILRLRVARPRSLVTRVT